ncbi:hypothetical protein TTHERM_000112879 (macronuclear) [Tetrahymena thermophila SB210]|uniref:Uncharacterized protein n=1 Tax=Tetrahymena thermophila (strain SB210) TaxID=312017 RepID=W7XDU0_TETTS|nr:hypothetical protein TTHERM_000112879 [Tetrahymena thermophila SB210]EWS75772.1 hypothetical protein TTHERM_000112879 [Tetrahymena thermophila SB210]|eukprot:XP_012651694.1 hypothetical protein TTHERM_000112879 [Tetrahymena thermophila SB210]
MFLKQDNQQLQCVSICNNNQIANTSNNQCVQSSICTQNYISQATLSNNQVIQDIIAYSSQVYLVKYNGFLNIIDSQSGQFIVSIKTNSQVLLCDFIFNKLIIVSQDNSVSQLIVENQLYLNLYNITQGNVSSSSIMTSISQDLIVITSISQNKQNIFLNIFRSNNKSFIFISTISIQIYNQKFYIFDSYIMLLSQQNNLKLLEIVENNLNTVSLQTISNFMECGFTADIHILSALMTPDQNSIYIFIQKSLNYYSYSKLLHSCSKINLTSNLIKHLYLNLII